MERENKSVGKWISKVMTRTGSQSTRRNYLYYLKRFCEKVGQNPDELIKERKEHLKSSDEDVKRQHEERLLEYFNELCGKSSRNTALVNLKAIRSFYKSNYVELKIETPGAWAAVTDKVPSLEDISKMVDMAKNPVEKALLLFAAQSGQRVGVVSAMTYGMVKEGLNRGKSPVCIQVSGALGDSRGEKVNKNRQTYCFFIGADSINALKTYIEHMRVMGHTFEDNSPLFMTDSKLRGFGGTKDIEATFRPVDKRTMNRIIRRCAIKAGLMDAEGIQTPGGVTRYPIHFHCMRKFWVTAMEQAGVAKPWYEFMEGHSLGALDRAYSRPTVQQLRDAYARAESYMNVSRLNIPDLDRLKKDLLLSVMRQQAQALGMDADKIRISIEKEKEDQEGLTVDGEIELLQRMILERTMRNKAEKTPEHKVIDEVELVDYLNKGWECVRELNGGEKVIVKAPF